MQRARAFFLVCAGLFLLALSYHLGATSATAQAPGNPVVSVALDGGVALAVTSSGDTYASTNFGRTWGLFGQVFGDPTPVQQSTWGSVKARYRGERQPTPTDR